uniref:Uncharacterized protein n=1 Tax=Aegilops tauschii subsp. strangulata TaxID=200361 RepID=A0A453EG16_AEGTS
CKVLYPGTNITNQSFIFSLVFLTMKYFSPALGTCFFFSRFPALPRCYMSSFRFTFFKNLLPELQHSFNLCGRRLPSLTLSSILFAS